MSHRRSEKPILASLPARRLAPFAVALVSTIAGLTVGALFASTSEAAAQERLAAFAERHNLADDASALFAHTASGGSSLAKGSGEWVVKFNGVPKKALAFEDRPGRREEAIGMRRMLAGFFEKPGADPPNAALSLETRGTDQTLVGVELLDGHYNRDRDVVRYRLRSLKQHGDQPLRLPRQFGDSSVFIDTIYNYCSTMVVGAPPLALTGANKYSHDDWRMVPKWDDGSNGPPPGTLASPGSLWVVWGSESGFARGCWNNANYADENGSVEFSVSDPYSGSNTYSCTGTGAYVCTGPWDYPWGGNGKGEFSDLTGDILSVIYTVCPASQPDCAASRGLVPVGSAGSPERQSFDLKESR